MKQSTLVLHGRASRITRIGVLALLIGVLGSACSYMDTREKGEEHQERMRDQMGKTQEGTEGAVTEATTDATAAAILAKTEAQQAEVKAKLYEVARTLSSYLKFENDSAEITGTAETQLTQLSELLSQLPSEKIKLSGFTDSRGEREHNQVLSQKRVESVRDFMMSHGVRAEQVQLEAMGETSPVATNRTEEGRSLNRRVEVAVGSSAG